MRLKQNQAGWDFDMPPNLYEQDELLEWGFEDQESKPRRESNRVDERNRPGGSRN